jgi:hypothetical protein
VNAEVQLARAEAVRLLRHPAVWLALATLVPWTRAAMSSDAALDGQYLLLIGFGLVLPGFVMMTVTLLAVLRGRMSGTDGLLITLPVGPDRRSVGHGLSTIAAALVGVLITAAIYVALNPSAPLGSMGDLYSPSSTEAPRPNLAQVLQGPVAIAAVCAIAVAIVRWIPTWLVVPPLLFLAASQFTLAGGWFGSQTSAGSWTFPLATGVVHGDWIGCTENDPVCDLPVSGFDQSTPWWHLGYLVAVAVLAVVVAVLRHRRDRTLWFALATSGAVVIVLAVVQAVVYDRYVP